MGNRGYMVAAGTLVGVGALVTSLNLSCGSVEDACAQEECGPDLTNEVSALEGRIETLESALQAQTTALADLDRRFETTAGNVCGQTGGAQPSGGYSAANALCRAVPTCAETAHMCTSTEVLRFLYGGGVLPNGVEMWVAGADPSPDRGAQVIGDCQGFTSADGASFRGATVTGAGTSITSSSRTCDAMIPILCCDHNGQ